MQIEIELPPEIQEQLTAGAHARGLAFDRYIEAKLNGSISSLPSPRRMSHNEFEASLDSLARYSDQIPSLPNEACSRESIYDDLDR